MEDEVDQCSVEKKCFEIEKKQLLINNDRLLEENISCDIMCTYLRSLNEVDNCGKYISLDIVLLDLQESNKSLCELEHHKEKMICNDSRTKHDNSLINAINNQSFEINDLKVQLQDKTLDSKIEDDNVSLAFQELLEEARALKHLDEHIGHASRFAERIQELLVNTKKHAVKQNTQKTDNTILPSKGRVSSTNASESKLRRNTKNDRIQRPSCRSKKNRVEAQPRKSKSISNKNNYVSDYNANIKNVALSKNSVNIFLSCNECLFSANHDAFVVKYLKDGKNVKRPNLLNKKKRMNGNQLVGSLKLTTVIPVDDPCPKPSLRYAKARESLSRSFLNFDSHPFNLHDFGFERISSNDELPP
ncbi:hypothetical protein Tco_1345120 [Tanacetum coccineum]